MEDKIKEALDTAGITEEQLTANGEAAKKAMEAKAEAARIMERARTEALLEKQKLKDDVKKEIISVASMMAGKVVAASIDTSVQDKLIEETLKEMGENTWLS